ncbi:MAG TPA: hypothetical protein VJQ08_06750 [Candidatus Dormibacteraeota bacterium]|nr:hypothetical protein [Candidatus Dormibacteraeota bacterium]
MIDVRCAPDGEGWLCQVQVEEVGRRTAHTVSVSGTDLDRWASGRGQSDAEDLVARSFAFLLQREPASSILRRFNLPEVQTYFAEFDQVMRESR